MIISGKSNSDNSRLIPQIEESFFSFGDNVFIAPNCGFYTAGHPLDAELRNQGLEYAFPIIVGNNIWFGAHVCVLPGVSIGDNALIAAGFNGVLDLELG